MKTEKRKKFERVISDTLILLVLIIGMGSGFLLADFALPDKTLDNQTNNFSEACHRQQLVNETKKIYEKETNLSLPDNACYTEELVEQEAGFKCMEKYKSAENLSRCIKNYTERVQQ